MIKEKQELIDEKIKKLNKKYNWKDTLSILGSVFFTTLGVFSVFSMPLYGLSLFGAGLGFFITNRGINKRQEDKEKCLLNEKGHLEKVSKEGLNASREMNEKRNKKVKLLQKTREQKEETRKKLSAINGIATIGLIPSAFIALSLPVVGVALSATFAAIKAFSENKLSKKSKDISVLDTRIENIKNDQEIILDIEAKKQAQSAQQPQVQQQTQDSTTVARTSTKKEQPASSQQVKFDKNANIAEQYINMMAKQSAQTSKPVQKVKK